MPPVFQNHLSKSAFTLIELLTGIAVIAILAAILFSISGAVREQVDVVESAANLRTLHTAAMSYASDHGGRLPAQAVSNSDGTGSNFILDLAKVAEEEDGYIELRNYALSGGDHYMFNPAIIRARTPPPYCGTTYSINIHVAGGLMRDGAVARASATDGLLHRIAMPSETALFMDGPWNGITWPVQIGGWGGSGSPSNYPDFPHPASSIGTEDPNQFAQVVYIDGHVGQVTRQDFPLDWDTPFWKGDRQD